MSDDKSIIETTQQHEELDETRIKRKNSQIVEYEIQLEDNVSNVKVNDNDDEDEDDDDEVKNVSLNKDSTNTEKAKKVKEN